MFHSIGRRIRVLARLICYIGILASAIGMIAVWFTPRYPNPGGFVIFLSGLAVGIGGLIGAYIAGCLVYGFGRLVDDTAAIRARLDRPRPELKPNAEQAQAAEESGEAEESVKAAA